MAAKIQTHSGCVPCRRRKKRCEGATHSDCKNCQTEGLLCTWPTKVRDKENNTSMEANEFVKVGKKKISKNRKSSLDSLSVTSTKPNGKLPGVIPITSQDFDLNKSFVSLPRLFEAKSSSKNYFLQRIAMQQDCVDGYEDTLIDKEKVAVAGPSSDIKNRIAQQLDIGSEE